METKNVTNKKLTLVVNGRFHTFDYAAKLYKKGLLHKLISTMPYSVAKRFNIGREVYIGLPFFEVLKRGYRKIFKRELPVIFYSKLFTKTALLFVPKNTDVIISFAGYSEEIFKSPKYKNTIKILDRGSTHTLANIELNKLAAEYHRINWTPNPKRFVERELREYELADKIVMPSSFVKQTFIANGIPVNKIIQIPYSVSLKKFEGLNIKSKSKKSIILFVGQISSRKGIGVLINAMKIVIEKNLNAELWLVGHKNQQIDDALLNEPWVKHFGVLKKQELFDKYNQATIFCLPSFEEGLAFVLTEAKYCGLSIVATPNSGVADIISNEESNNIVPVGDHNKTAERIIAILKDPKSLNSKNNGKENTSNMNWEKYSDILINSIFN